MELQVCSRDDVIVMLHDVSLFSDGLTSSVACFGEAEVEKLIQLLLSHTGTHTHSLSLSLTHSRYYRAARNYGG